jgi:hypothetical protein
MTVPTKSFYTSSNGDTWSLCRSRSGDIVVSHQPNNPPGGNPSEIDLGTFLANENRGPEHQSLRRMIEELVETEHVQAEYDDHE